MQEIQKALAISHWCKTGYSPMAGGGGGGIFSGSLFSFMASRAKGSVRAGLVEFFLRRWLEFAIQERRNTWSYKNDISNLLTKKALKDHYQPESSDEGARSGRIVSGFVGGDSVDLNGARPEAEPSNIHVCRAWVRLTTETQKKPSQRPEMWLCGCSLFFFVFFKCVTSKSQITSWPQELVD